MEEISHVCTECLAELHKYGNKGIFHQKCADILNIPYKDTSLPAKSVGGTGAVKADENKPRYDLIPPDALNEVAKVLEYGSRKYGDRNWEKGLDHGRLFAAAQRHLWVYERGMDKDKESNLRHLSHAATCVMMLLASTMRGIGTDDRPGNSIGDQI
jgi:hypothetical protein